MGYSTDFTGNFKVTWLADGTPYLSPNHRAFLVAFSRTRRMRRTAQVANLPDPARDAAGLDLGPEGGYYVGGADQCVADRNEPPAGQPSLWCQWTPTDDGSAIEWDEGEKFDEYVEWLEYLIEHFLGPWGYVLNGEVAWSGEEQGDVGRILVVDNEVTVKRGRVVYD